MSSSVLDLSLADAAAALRSRQVSSVELTRACLERAEAINPRLNCFLSIEADDALASARRADEVRTRGESAGTLHGIPLYDADAEQRDGLPGAVTALKDRVIASDGVLLFTPEYNNGIPGVFKNAIDWLSRPADDIPRVFGDRPFAVLGASPGGFGTILAQDAWLPVLRTLRVRYWSGGRLQVSRAHTLMDADGELADEWQDPGVDGDTLAFLQYTSGSTRLPKGVMVSHGNLFHNERTIQRAFEHTEESTFVGWLPLYHDMGLIGNVLQPLFIGALSVLMSLPLAVVGSLGAMALTTTPFTLFSLLGFTLLVGLVGKNAILLVDYTDILRRRGLTRTAALVQAGPTRLRPIVMTTLSVVVALLPLAIGLEEGSEALTLERIGALLGVTRERIRQIRERAFQKLRESPDLRGLEGFWGAA